MPLYCADAFTTAAFTGNPAGVCVLRAPADAAWMQRVAAELRHSETAFLAPQGPGRWSLRWFTPTVEVDLCGHATLAGAHVLWTEGHADPAAALTFETASGVLTAERDGEEILLDFPADPPAAQPAPGGLLTALGVAATWTGRSRLGWVVEVGSDAEVREVEPDLRQLATAGGTGAMVTAAGGGGYDFVSRFFAPAIGIDEDPVTGAAHCALAPHWARRLGQAELTGYQASARGGTVRVRWLPPRVLLGGRVVTVWRGELTGAAT